MAINPSQLSAQPIEQNNDIAIEMLTVRPTVGVQQPTSDTPNKLVGYYDGLTDQVELYVVDNSGYRYLKIV